MGSIRALFRLLVAALLITTAGPAMAKQDQKADQTTNSAQKKSEGKDCVTTAPPFMRNPRFMNRGFFKRKCKTK